MRRLSVSQLQRLAAGDGIKGLVSPRHGPRFFSAEHVSGLRNSGDVYEQAVVKTVAGFFRGSPTHLFGVTRFGTPVVYVRASSSHPAIPGAQFRQFRNSGDAILNSVVADILPFYIPLERAVSRSSPHGLSSALHTSMSSVPSVASQ